MSNGKKIVIVGAGSLQFGLGTAGSILESEILEDSTISLHDINAESLELAKQACSSAIENKKYKIILESTTIRKDALKGADFIINSIEVPPRFELWDQDYQIPIGMGNKQIFGENGGPGGLFHSLRVVPPILEICEDVSKICPNALFINFSNPMSRVCLAIKRKFPKLKSVGLCHEIAFAQKHLPLILDTPLTDLEYKAGGLNHFGVITEIDYKNNGKDAYPDLREKGIPYMHKLKELDGHSLVSYIFEKYSFMPYTGDSHYGEYIQWAWEKADMDGVRGFKSGYTEYIHYIGKRIIRLIKKGKGGKMVKKDDERAIPIIEGILTNSNHQEISVNLPNEGVISNLPQDLVIECPAIVNKDGLHAVKLGEYPKGLAALLRNQASVQDLVVEAILTNSKDIALQALLADPVVDSATQAERMLDRMLEIQKDYIKLE